MASLFEIIVESAGQFVAPSVVFHLMTLINAVTFVSAVNVPGPVLGAVLQTNPRPALQEFMASWRGVHAQTRVL